VRFGRKQDATSPSEEEPTTEEVVAAGPHDYQGPDDPDGYVDLGSLLIPPQPGLELRLQIDEASNQVLAVLLVGEDGMLELRAFAASRGGDLWSEVRSEIAADTTRRGGTATEQDGPLGVELHCQIPVQLDDGTAGVQPSRVLGHNGSRWFLRAALLGRPAVEPQAAEPWIEVIRSVAVRRGQAPLPPGEALPLRLPAGAQRVD